jgi:hypothetical protein
LVTFSAVGPIGDKSANLQINHNAGGSPAIIPLEGTLMDEAAVGDRKRVIVTVTGLPEGSSITLRNIGGSDFVQRFEDNANPPLLSVFPVRDFEGGGKLFVGSQDSAWEIDDIWSTNAITPVANVTGAVQDIFVTGTSSSPVKVYVATDAGLRTSGDGYNGVVVPGNIRAVAVNELNVNYVALATSAGVLFSSDFESFSPTFATINGPFTIPSNVVKDVVFADNKLWVATANGIGVLSDSGGNVFDSANWGQSLPGKSVNKIYVGDFHAYAATNDGLWRATLSSGLPGPWSEILAGEVIEVSGQGSMVVAYLQSGGDLQLSGNSGDTWAPLDLGTAGPVEDLIVREGVLYVVVDNHLRILDSDVSDLTVSANGTYLFPKYVNGSPGAYNVVVIDQEGLTCTGGSQGFFSSTDVEVFINCNGGGSVPGPVMSSPQTSGVVAAGAVSEPLAPTVRVGAVVGSAEPIAAVGGCRGDCVVEFQSVESSATDETSGSRYRVLRSAAAGLTGQQSWLLEYRSSTGLLFARSELPSTAEVSWRLADGREARLPTTGWALVCGDRVWTLQDGYELLAHVGDPGLSRIEGSTVVLGTGREQSAAMSVLSGAQCTTGGGLRLRGYALGVGDREPPLRSGSMNASGFEVVLDRSGAVIGRSAREARFDVKAHCATAANEQFAFCEAARQAVGW